MEETGPQAAETWDTHPRSRKTQTDRHLLFSPALSSSFQMTTKEILSTFHLGMQAAPTPSLPLHSLQRLLLREGKRRSGSLATR